MPSAHNINSGKPEGLTSREVKNSQIEVWSKALLDGGNLPEREVFVLLTKGSTIPQSPGGKTSCHDIQGANSDPVFSSLASVAHLWLGGISHEAIPRVSSLGTVQLWIDIRIFYSE